MNRIGLKFLLVFFASVLLFTACGNEWNKEYDRRDRLEVSSTNVTINAIDTFRLVYVSHDKHDWEVVVNDTNKWVHVEKLPLNDWNEATFKVTCDDYFHLTANRNGTVYVRPLSGNAVEKAINIRQNYYRDVVTLTPDSISFEPEFIGTLQVEVFTDAALGWDYVGPVGIDWLKIERVNNTLYLSTDRLNIGRERATSVTVRSVRPANGGSVTSVNLPVTQQQSFGTTP